MGNENYKTEIVFLWISQSPGLKHNFVTNKLYAAHRLANFYDNDSLSVRNILLNIHCRLYIFMLFFSLRLKLLFEAFSH